MTIIPGKTYRIKGSSPYFKEKYGTHNPLIRVEDWDTKVFGGSWLQMTGNPACIQFAMRSILGLADPLQRPTPVWYGKVNSLGELVWEDELEEVE